MSTVSTFVLSAGYILGSVWQLAGYAIRFGWALLLPRALLAARLVAVESQLAVELGGSDGARRRRQFSAAFRMLWVALSKLLDGWEDLAHPMKPETVKRWHTTAFRLFWRWRSRQGRPPMSPAPGPLTRGCSMLHYPVLRKGGHPLLCAPSVYGISHARGGASMPRI